MISAYCPMLLFQGCHIVTLGYNQRVINRETGSNDSSIPFINLVSSSFQ